MRNLKDEIERFIKYDLNEYRHEQWVTTQEGSQICGFIKTLIDKIGELENEIIKLEEAKNK